MDIKFIAELFYEHCTHFKGHSPETIRRHKYVINLYCKYCEITDIKQVTQENIRTLFYHGRTKRKWSVNTFHVFHKSLFVFFKWCIGKGYMTINPIEGIERPRLERSLPKRLTKQDALYLLEVVHNYPYKLKFLRYRNHALFAMFVFAGLRRSELLQLGFADVDLQNMTIFIRQGKGKKDRFVPISIVLAEILNKYIQERQILNRTCPAFFTSSQQNTGLTDDGLKHLVERVRKMVGWKFSVHKLRHTFATLMIEGGCDIYSLSKMMGHSQITTTTIYLSASSEHLRAQMMKHPLNDPRMSIV